MKENWQKCTFEDLLDYVQPTKYIVKSTKYDNSYETPVLTAGKSFIKGYTNEKEGLFENLPTIIFDDFTTASKFVNFKFKVKSSAMKILVPTSELVDMQFIFYCMQVNRVRSDTHKRYWISIYAKKEIQIPPLPEQRAIVAKIEELFSSLDSGIADLQKAQAQLKVFKLSVLSNVSKGNKKATLDEVIDNLTQGWSPKCINQSSADPEEWAVIKTSAIQSNEFREAENKILPTTLEPRTQHEIQVGDILITRAGPRVRVGVCCLVKKTRPKLINCDKVYRIRVDRTKILPEFLEYSLNAPEHLKEIEKMKSGSSDSGLNLTQTRFLSLEISLPSIKEQHQIVQEIESRLSVCDKVEESILENLEKAKALRQSILKKAFEGKLLTEQELAACKAEPDYEPAGVLLKRIKSSKN